MVDGDFKKFEGKWSIRSGPRWGFHGHRLVLFIAYAFDDRPDCLLTELPVTYIFGSHMML